MEGQEEEVTEEEEYKQYQEYQNYLNSQKEPGAGRAAAEFASIGTAQQLKNARPRNASDLRAMGEAALVGPAQAVTFGHVPEIAGGISSLVKGTPYLEERDQAYKDVNEIKARAPLTFGVTNLGSNLLLPMAKAKTIKGMMGIGAGVGAAQNPGAEEGVLDPLQVGERAAGAGFGAGMGGLLGGIGRAATAGGRASKMAAEMEKPFFSKKMAAEVEDTAERLGREYVKPRSVEARKVLSGKQISFRPDILENAEEPGLMAAMQKRTPKAQKAAASARSGGLSPPAPAAPGDELVTLNAATADRVRRRLEKNAYKQKGALASPEAVKAAEGKVSAASTLRAERNKVAPELAKNYEEQKYALDLMEDVRQRSANPQTMMAANSDTASKLIDVDHLAGTKMYRLGNDLKAANYLRGNTPEPLPFYLRGPTRWGANAAAYMGRPAAFGQSLMENYAPGTAHKLSPAAIRLMIEEAMRGPEYEEAK